MDKIEALERKGSYFSAVMGLATGLALIIAVGFTVRAEAGEKAPTKEKSAFVQQVDFFRAACQTGTDHTIGKRLMVAMHNKYGECEVSMIEIVTEGDKQFGQNNCSGKGIRRAISFNKNGNFTISKEMIGTKTTSITFDPTGEHSIAFGNDTVKTPKMLTAKAILIPAIEEYEELGRTIVEYMASLVPANFQNTP